MHEKISIDNVCFPGAPFVDVARYWRELQAQRVSLIGYTILNEDLRTIRDEITACGYQVETIAHPFLSFRPLEPREESWRGPRETLTRLIDAAAELGAKSIYLLSGGHGTLTWEQAAECFSAAIAPCVTHAHKAGIALATENASSLHADNHIAHTLRDAITLAEMAGIGLCIDVYNCWVEAGLHDSIKRAIPRCQIVQLSDYVYGDRALPCRAVPGDGAIPIERITRWMLESGYQGAFDLELIGPRIDKEGHLEATRRAAERIGKMLNSLGV
jgi:sugar phosphate isomerase/epimerase